MKIFDCTLRDGANVVGFGFDKALTTTILDILIESGIKDIEFGSAKGLGAFSNEKLSSPLSDEDYFEIADEYSSKCNLGMFQLAKYASDEYSYQAKKHGLNFIRIGNDAGNGLESLSAIESVKRAGLICRYSIMKAYVLTPEELANEAQLLEKAGVDIITIMDSAGFMLPSDVENYILKIKEKVSIPIGFHGHNNLGLSQGNAMAAVLAGADEIDCGLLGMARSAGNCCTELTVAMLQRKNLLSEINLMKLIELLDTKLIPMMKEHDYHVAVKPIDLVLGYSGCHSSFLNQFKKIANEKQVNLYDLIIAVSKENKKNPNEEYISEIAVTL